MKIENHTLVTIDYVLTNDQQEKLYSSKNDASIIYLHGGGLLDGLEQALEEKTIGEHFSVILLPADACGDKLPELVQTMHMDEFNSVEMREGMEL